MLAAILLQAAAAQPLPVIALPAPPPRARRTVAPDAAIRMFREICLPHLADRSRIARAARRAGFRLAPDARPELGADSWVRGAASLHYNPAGLLPPHVDQPQCILRTWLDSRVEEADFRRRFIASVRPGRLTRREPVLTWERPARRGRSERIGLQMDRLSHGQIIVIFSTALRSGVPKDI